MPETGRLRFRGDQLIVESFSGRTIAQIEPDDDMRIEAIAAPAGAVVPLTVTWLQPVPLEASYVDVGAKDVSPVGAEVVVQRA